MPSFEMTRSELVRAFLEIGTLLTGPKPLDERMTGLCAAGCAVLDSDQLAVMQLDGDHYFGVYQFGMRADHAKDFTRYRVRRDKEIIGDIENCDHYLLYNSASTNPRLKRIAQIVGVRSVIIVPFTHPDGAPFGYVTVSYFEDKPTVTTGEAELAVGIARLVQTTLLRNLETSRRREVSQAMLQVADSERRRLSRDIHDDPLQRILALRIGLEGFREQLHNVDMQTTIDSFIAQCRGASASLREVMLRTHPNASELADLEDVLNRLVKREDARNAITLTFDDARSTESPSYLVPALNRIAEQAARNTLHHANASELRIRLADSADGTLLTISDDGQGFDPSVVDSTRLGLVSMRERTELLGGTFSVDSSPGAGTSVSSWFPHTQIDESTLTTDIDSESPRL